MKKSKAVPLLLLGTLGVLAGCGQNKDIDVRQNSYRSLEDCRRDWGTDPRDCRSGGNAGAYIGPRYFYNHAGGYPVAVDTDGSTRPLSNSYIARGAQSTAVGSTSSVARASASSHSSSVSRGGFGGTARGFSGGG